MHSPTGLFIRLLKSFENHLLSCCAHNGFDPVVTVLKLGYGNDSRIKLLTVNNDVSNTLAYVLGILNFDVKILSSEYSVNAVSVPGVGDTRIDKHSVVLRSDSENILGE